MNSSTWNRSTGPAPRSNTVARSLPHALLRRLARAVGRWWAAHLNRPVHYRMGAFDAARSARARQMLEHRRR